MFGFGMGNGVEISVTKEGNYYVFENIAVHLLALDLTAVFKTAYLPNVMINKIRSNKFRVHEFFMVELFYSLGKAIHLRKTRTRLNVLVKLLHLVETETWIKRTIDPKVVPNNYDKTKGLFKTTPYDLQKQFLETYNTITSTYLLSGMLLDSAPGTGKTFTSFFWTEMINDNKTIILCPDHISFNVFEEEFKKHFKKVPRVWYSQRDLPLTGDYDYYVIHYSGLISSVGERCEYFFREQIKKTKKQYNLIVDECHNFNEETSQRSIKLVDWKDQGFFEACLPMSGTPLKAMGREAFVTFCLIDELFIGRARKLFNDLYGKSREALNELLRNRIGRSKFTIPSIDGLGPTPPVEIIPIRIPNGERYTLKNVRSEMMIYIEQRVLFYKTNMPAYKQFFAECLNSYEHSLKGDKEALTDLKHYRQIVDRFQKKGFQTFNPQDIEDNAFCKIIEEYIADSLPREDRKQFLNIRSAIKYLGLKLRGEALGNVLGKMREEAATSLIAHAGIPTLIKSAKKKTMIFSSYVTSVLFCESFLEKKGFHPITVYGETNDMRDDNLKAMAVDKKLNPGIATFKSLKEGTPCLFANQIILLNAPFRDNELKQVLARVWRKGQTDECFFWLLDLDTGDELNIASRSIDIMKWSAEQVDQMISKIPGYEGMGDLRGVTGTEALEIPDLVWESMCVPLQKGFTSSVFSIF